jgi:hypothetical protein
MSEYLKGAASHASLPLPRRRRRELERHGGAVPCLAFLRRERFKEL